LVNATVPVVDRFGWTTFSAIVWTQVSNSVDTTAGAFTTVDTMKTSLSRATPVLLQTVCSSELTKFKYGDKQFGAITVETRVNNWLQNVDLKLVLTT